MHKLTLVLALAALLVPAAGAGGRAASRAPKTTYRAPRPAKKARAGRAPNTKCPTCERDNRGRIKRSDAARQRFQKTNPCPATGRTPGGCPGYEIDHRVPLSKGGADAPGNMQWLTDEQHKAKHSSR